MDNFFIKHVCVETNSTFYVWQLLYSHVAKSFWEICTSLVIKFLQEQDTLKINKKQHSLYYNMNESDLSI